MSIITDSRQIAAEHLFVLSRTRKIETQDLELPEWKFLLEEYNVHRRSVWIERALISLINAIVFQRLVFFLMSRRLFRELCRTDMNWSKPIGLKDENYRKLVQEAILRKFIQVEEKLPNGNWVWRVIHPTLLNHIAIDLELQKKSVTDYAKLFRNPADLAQGTSKGNQDKDIERAIDETSLKSDPILSKFPKESPGEIHTNSTEGIPHSEGLRFTRLGKDSERTSALANAPGVPNKSIAMMHKWEERGYPNGLSRSMLKTLSEMESKYLMISPSGEKLDAVDAYVLLGEFVQKDPWPNEPSIRASFVGYAGPVVARLAFAECEKKDRANLKWIIDLYRKSAKKTATSTFSETPQTQYQSVPYSVSSIEGSNALSLVRGHILANPGKTQGTIQTEILTAFGHGVLADALVEAEVTGQNLWAELELGGNPTSGQELTAKESDLCSR